MRRLLLVLAVLLAVPSLWVVDVALDRADAGVVLTKVQTADDAEYDPGRWKDTIFVLLVGSDERPGLEGARGDALHLVGLNPSQGRATILNFPRDTWVDVPGYGVRRINEAYQLGGAQLQAETVRRLTGVPVTYVLTTTFGGLVAMVDSLGGLEVDVPYPMDDQNSGAAFAGGRQMMSGAQVLAFSRNRHIPDGDINRTAHQGQVIIHTLAKLRAEGTSGTDVLRYLDVLFRSVRVDGVSPTDLYRLGRAALRIDPGAVRNYTIPVRIGFAGSASVVFVRPEATRVFEDFRDDAVLQAH